MGDQPVARPLPTQDNTNRIKADNHARVGFEPTIPVFKRAKMEILRQNYVRNNCVILAERSYRQECLVKITGGKQKADVLCCGAIKYNALTFNCLFNIHHKLELCVN
jgi:hypothetical protein